MHGIRRSTALSRTSLFVLLGRVEHGERCVLRNVQQAGLDTCLGYHPRARLLEIQTIVPTLQCTTSWAGHLPRLAPCGPDFWKNKQLCPHCNVAVAMHPAAAHACISVVSILRFHDISVV